MGTGKRTAPAGEQAVVIGASMAGLCAARVLADRFTRVVVLDRDVLTEDPTPRRLVPQGRHPHLLLTAGARLLDEWFPGLTTELYAAGAVELDLCARLPVAPGRRNPMPAVVGAGRSVHVSAAVGVDGPGPGLGAVQRRGPWRRRRRRADARRRGEAGRRCPDRQAVGRSPPISSSTPPGARLAASTGWPHMATRHRRRRSSRSTLAMSAACFGAATRRPATGRPPP